MALIHFNVSLTYVIDCVEQKQTNTLDTEIHPIKSKIIVKCQFCNKEMVGTSLSEHIKQVHQDESLRTCHLCEKVGISIGSGWKILKMNYAGYADTPNTSE